MNNSMLLTDGYKLDHRRQYPDKTEYIYANWTARSNNHYPAAKDGYVVFGIQYMITKYLIEDFNNNFFNQSLSQISKNYLRRINTFLGPNQVGVEHIEALHKLGYLPIKIKALPEGILCPIGVPCLTITNTLPEFFWLVNYLETLISNVLWMPMTSATTARLYKKRLYEHAEKTGWRDNPTLDFLCHDFSMRGMAGIESSILSGMGHLTSFVGSETIPAIEEIERYYDFDAEKGLLAGTVPATEHSVMCAGSKENEIDTFKRLLDLYPSGFVSIVSDTWDLWKVCTEYLPTLKDQIMARDGRLVIRPDSGDPVDIICGLSPHFKDDYGKPEYKGVYELLWDTFGGIINEKGYKVLDTHVGIIYGDAITLERQDDIYRRLEEKGFCASNLVLGIGSYTYQYVTRDSLGFALKTTWCQIDGQAQELFKRPITDNGVKNSLKGLLRVDLDDDNKIVVFENQIRQSEEGGLLSVIFKNGHLFIDTHLQEIRERINMTL